MVFLFQAIILLYQQVTFEDHVKDAIRKTYLNELNLPNNPSSNGSKDELNFIKKALQLLLEIDSLSIMVIVELMSQYVLGNPQFR